VAKRVEQITLGIDVSKDKLDSYHWEREECLSLANERAPIRAWLKGLSGPVRIALEPTSTYHLVVVEEAVALGIKVYLVNPRQLVHYREAVNQRNKTDPDDAWLLGRFLAHEHSQLRPFQPQCRQAQQLWALLKRRAVVVSARKQLTQSLAGINLSARALFTQMTRVLERIDRRMQALVKALHWTQAYQRCLSIPGIGPLNAAALVTAYHRGAFASSDAFVAYLGLDVRVRESGRFTGMRKLTKRGEAELRRLLYCAAASSRSYPRFGQYYQRQLEKGLPKTAANVILGRKLARIAFALIRNEQSFNHDLLKACSMP